MKHIVLDKKFLHGNRVILRGKDYHYLKNVRRFKVGDYIKALIEDEVVILYISENNKNNFILDIVDKKQVNRIIKPGITIFHGLIKSKKMDLLISRLSEIGIKELFPVITERSILKNNVGDNKIDRWRRIAKEGSKVSELEDVLKINQPLKLEELKTKNLENFEVKLLFSTGKDSEHIRIFLEKLNNPINKSFCLFFGPEGGFSSKEEVYLQNLGFINIGLGPFIMRSETAAIAAASFIRIFYSNELNQE